MKALLLTSLLSISLFAQEIVFEKTFSKTLLAKQMNAQIEIAAYRHKSEKTAIVEIDKFTKALENAGLKKYNVNYNVNQEYVFKKNQRVFNGFKATYSFTIKSDSYEKIDSFVTKLYKLPRLKTTVIALNSVFRTPFEREVEESKDALLLDAIDFSNAYAKKLSARLQKKMCASNTSCK